MKPAETQYNSFYFIEDIKRIPFLRLVIPFLAGIVLQYYLALISHNALYIIGFLLILMLVLHRLKIYKNYGFRWFFAVHCFVILFFTGIYLVQIQPDKSTVPLGENNFYKLLITKNPRINEKSVRFDVDIQAFSSDGKHWNKCSERAIVYFSKGSATNLVPGDVFMCETSFNEVPPPLNPEEFNYKKYLERHRIFSTAFVDSEKTALIASGQISFYSKFIQGLQASSYRILQNAGLGEEELAVALALLIGNQEYIDDELNRAYVSSGSVHLLAVSGLHVGIIFMIISFFLQAMNRDRKLRIIKGIIILAVLWIYSSIAGMAPSIVRASTMFSIFVVADMIGKPKNTYNNIAFSCFLICLINPYSLFDIGFQLSYLAVIGIVYFQPKFMKFLYSRNKIINAVNSCLTVTLAAQLGTLPIILYVFKTFPVYFLFSNLILVPFTTFVMYIGLVTIALSWNLWLLSICGICLNFCTQLMNTTVRFFHTLPFSVMDGINIDGWQCTVLVFSILFFALLLSFGKRIFVKMMLISFLLIFSIRAIHKHNSSSHSELGIFGLRKNFYAYFIENGKGFSVRDSLSFENSFDFNTKNYLITRGFVSEKDLNAFSLNDSIPDSYRGIVLFSGCKIALLSQLEISDEFAGTPLNVDYLFVTEMRRENPETVFSCYLPKEIIIAGNLTANKTAEWQNAAELKQIPCRNVKEQGFWNKILKN